MPNLVLTDLGMQGTNGALLSRVPGEMYPHVPIIFMSADFDLDVVPMGLPDNAVLLRKPVLAEDLVAAIGCSFSL
ncbi:hypothetical protein [Paraburkholderia sp. RL17-337-BIB-A]|uniref:hypothetical protein n=1 Tax=Paraburkholderia sp. RL17-337-BIB-A TaxID=3031636 RepID=UPI0038BD94D3